MERIDTDLSGVPHLLRAPVREFAQGLGALAGRQLLGLTVYGMALEAAFQPEHHAIRSALVLATIDLDLLKQLGRDAPRPRGWRFSPPVIMTPQAIAASRDTFPLELIEIQQRHAAICGADHFTPLEFDPAHVRLQCERDLKVFLIAMHQGLLASGGREERLGTMSAELTGSLLRVLSGLLWLAGQRQPQPLFHRVEAVEKLIKRPLPGICGALDRSDMAGWHKFRRLYDDLVALDEYADAL